ncbi:MAG TPA: methyltransferase domain-containing protein [Pseudonocardiaceae bacterium]
MSEIVNTAQAEAWNGYEGEHWASNDDRFDKVNGGYNATLLDAAGIGTDDAVLDIGCGNGQLTRQAALRAKRASGVDLSEPMLATARARAAEESVGNVDFFRGDAQVHPFESGSLDVALSRFGVMFFADPVAAFTNVHRALRPSGRLAFLCLDEFDRSDVGRVFEAMQTWVPWPTGQRNSGPTSLADPEHTEELLTTAGFHDVTQTPVQAEQWWGTDATDAAAFMASWGPVHYHLGLVGAAAARRATGAMTEALRAFEGPAGVVLRGHAWLVSAQA